MASLVAGQIMDDGKVGQELIDEALHRQRQAANCVAHGFDGCDLRTAHLHAEIGQQRVHLPDAGAGRVIRGRGGARQPGQLRRPCESGAEPGAAG